MNVRSLSNLLNSLSPDDAADDAVLLSRYLAKRSEAAFTALVRRHGRLVWTVCRNLTGSDADADDAFQATFVVLIEKAWTLKDPARLAPWLHGVAARICLAMRRKRVNGQRRERAIANSEHSTAVPETAWDRALSAVHEEAAQLPESLRVPFVLCCLEGRSVTETADQLGWKLGTFSGRLTRAKDRIMARLGDRGLVFGAIASIGLSIPPTASVTRAATLSTAAIPSTILELTQGAIAMNVSKIKLLAATVLVSFGISAIGTGWMAQAQLQGQEKKGQPQATAEPNLDRLIVANASTAPTFTTEKWQYDLVEVRDIGVLRFEALLREREKNGWEFVGQTKLSQSISSDVWVFRKPAKSPEEKGRELTRLVEETNKQYLRAVEEATNRAREKEISDLRAQKKDNLTRRQLRDIDQRIAELQGRVIFFRDELPIDMKSLANVLPGLIEDKFKTKQFAMLKRGDCFELEASQEIRDWAQEFVRKLAQK